MDEIMLSLIGLLIARLERISADSVLAHRASGVRGALLSISDMSKQNVDRQQTSIAPIVEVGFAILESAARDKSGK